ncbi:uncharacterized protein P174DRAFT_439985 [Aspergillus novofumigatus IBT 16806]|uniref:Apple domain-containing protein n=1 Tax=Aspergillus novofumigatus (strain IBT 16806) TaxID=1392255 RepID=A0A2I1CCL8_ASPN1|nr:uncharacterized protein P174DRAFT_439985 [Aspergillus novofumigatus IBT 16806]PKX95373.1 hypothetical protein P174DRAFT_439985 [Aspergillus novofumigatus IBT 16806]
MKAPVIWALSLTCGLVYGQTAQQHYDRICTFPSDEEVEVEPGLFVTYHCGQYAPPNNQYQAYAASTPEDCVKGCVNKGSGCLGSAWTSLPSATSACLHAKHSSLPALVNKNSVVFMTYRKAEENGEDPFGESTLEQLQKCKDDLAACKVNEAKLAECERNAAAGPQVPPYMDCPAGKDQIITIGNRPFKQKCDMAMAKAAADIYRTIQPGLTHEECALICALDPKCKSAMSVRTTSTAGECQLSSRNIEPSLTNWAPNRAYVPV